jgi:hypothetical protein
MNDPVVGIDNGDVAGCRDVGTYFADLAILDQDVGLGEIADQGIDGKNDRTLDEDAARALQAHQLGIASALGIGSPRQSLRGGAAGDEADTGFQKSPT